MEIITKKRKYSPEVLAKKRIVALKNLEKARAKIKRDGYKWKSTILKENWEAEQRDNYLAMIEPYFPQITIEQIQKALTGDGKMLQYITNQLIGKPKDRIEQDLSSEALKKIEAQDKAWLENKPKVSEAVLIKNKED